LVLAGLVKGLLGEVPGEGPGTHMRNT
jgi:hypothetical protein